MKKKLKETDSVQELGLSTRLGNALISEGFTTIGEVCRLAERDFLRIPNFGRKSLGDLANALSDHGFLFGVGDPLAFCHALHEDIRSLEEKMNLLRRALVSAGRAAAQRATER